MAWIAGFLWQNKTWDVGFYGKWNQKIVETYGIVGNFDNTWLDKR